MLIRQTDISRKRSIGTFRKVTDGTYPNINLKKYFAEKKKYCKTYKLTGGRKKPALDKQTDLW